MGVKWIPYNQEQPKSDMEVLATYQYGKIKPTVTICMYIAGEWFNRITGRQINNDNIKAWMPLPKPYIEE